MKDHHGREQPDWTPEDFVTDLLEYRAHVSEMWWEKWRADNSRKGTLATLRDLLKLALGKVTAEEFVEQWSGDPAEAMDKYTHGWTVHPWDEQAELKTWPQHWVESKVPDVPEGCTPVSFAEGLTPLLPKILETTQLATTDEAFQSVFTQLRYTIDVAKHETFTRSVRDATAKNKTIHKVRMLLLAASGNARWAEVGKALGLTPTELEAEMDFESSFGWHDGKEHDPNVIEAS